MDSLKNVAGRARAGEQQFDFGVREFIDSWQLMNVAERKAAVEQEPQRVDRVKDAYLAAVAEHLCTLCGLVTPGWSEKPERFLAEPHFAGGLESLKALLIVESPPAFRRRLIFVSANALFRPRREFIQDNALQVANLDV